MRLNSRLIFGKVPVAVMPPSYEIPLGLWKWCKIYEVCAIIPGIATIAGIEGEFKPTPEELVSNFVALVRPNRLSWPQAAEGEDVLKKKLFRYSLAGNGLCCKEVPTEGHAAPPYTRFSLDLGTPYPKDMFVPEGWVIDTLKAIRMGAVAAVDFGEYKIGFRPEKSKEGGIILERNPNAKSGGGVLVRRPSTV